MLPQLERDAVAISIEYYGAFDELLGYEDDPKYDPPTDDPSDPLFTVPGPTPDAAAEWYRTSGWLRVWSR